MLHCNTIARYYTISMLNKIVINVLCSCINQEDQRTSKYPLKEAFTVNHKWIVIREFDERIFSRTSSHWNFYV